jgi:hypothetical protein
MFSKDAKRCAQWKSVIYELPSVSFVVKLVNSFLQKATYKRFIFGHHFHILKRATYGCNRMKLCQIISSEFPVFSTPKSMNSQTIRCVVPVVFEI